MGGLGGRCVAEREEFFGKSLYYRHVLGAGRKS
jgi:hypothetical protein